MGSLVIWDLIDQFGSGGVAGIVVVDQSASDFKWPDWPHGAFDLADLIHVMHEVQTDRGALVGDFAPSMFKDPPPFEEMSWIQKEVMRPPASVASAIIFDQTMRDYRPHLAKVDVPALVITGVDEKVVSLVAEELTASSMRDARLVVFEDSGDCPFLEEPVRFNEVVDGFVREVSSTPA
jgi:pimeloyl-ACP methyl ester carboxylesterase